MGGDHWIDENHRMIIDDMLFGLIVCGLVLAILYVRADLRKAVLPNDKLQARVEGHRKVIARVRSDAGQVCANDPESSDSVREQPPSQKG